MSHDPWDIAIALLRESVKEREGGYEFDAEDAESHRKIYDSARQEQTFRDWAAAHEVDLQYDES